MGKKKKKDKERLSPRRFRVLRGMGLPSYFELYERNRFVLASDSTLWWFREDLRNGDYIRYTLKGNCLKIVKSLGNRYISPIACGEAHLYAKLLFDPYRGDTKVFIEDIITTRPSRHIGSFMMNVFIDFLREWDAFFFVEEIYGELGWVDEIDPVNKIRRDAFFVGFGFDFEEGRTASRKRYVIAKLENLKRKSLPDVQILEMDKAFQLLAERLAAREERETSFLRSFDVETKFR